VSPEQVIARQAIEIESMKEKLAEYKSAMEGIHGGLFNIGAPLNDNVRGYTRSQLTPFFWIAEKIDIDPYGGEK